MAYYMHGILCFVWFICSGLFLLSVFYFAMIVFFFSVRSRLFCFVLFWMSVSSATTTTTTTHTKKYRFKFDNGVYCCWVFLLSLVDCWVSCCCCCCNLVCVCVCPLTPVQARRTSENISRTWYNVLVLPCCTYFVTCYVWCLRVYNPCLRFVDDDVILFLIHSGAPMCAALFSVYNFFSSSFSSSIHVVIPCLSRLICYWGLAGT